MAIRAAAKGDLVLIFDPDQGLNGLYLVNSANVTDQVMDVYPIDATASLKEAKLADPLSDWPKTVTFDSVIAHYPAAAIGF